MLVKVYRPKYRSRTGRRLSHLGRNSTFVDNRITDLRVGKLNKKDD